jgi:hypothetical protein
MKREEDVLILLAHRAQAVNEPIPGRHGVEIDVRDHLGFPVMAHDLPTQSPESLYGWFSRDLDEQGVRPIYAINIKADGLEDLIVYLTKFYPQVADRIFVFDMSYPSLVRFRERGVPFAERISEEEGFTGQTPLIWMDRWNWTDNIPMGRRIAFDGGRPSIPIPTTDKWGKRCRIYAVSPELRVKDACPSWVEHYWGLFHEWGVDGVCTDWWDRAEDFFRKREEKAVWSKHYLEGSPNNAQ